MFHNTPDLGTTKQNREILSAATVRQRRFDRELGDIIRVLSRNGCVGRYALSSVEEIAECLRYPPEWAEFDAEVILILLHRSRTLWDAGLCKKF